MTKKKTEVTLTANGKRRGRPPNPPVPAGPAEIKTKAFEVEAGDTAKEIMELNGPKLVQWAFERAAQAQVTGSWLDADIAKLLIHKLVPAVGLKDAAKALPADVKRNIKALTRIAAAMDAEFKEVPAPAEAAGEASVVPEPVVEEEEGPGL